MTFNNKRIFLRGFNVVRDNLMLMIQPKPAQFSEKQDMYSIDKLGYILFDFTPMEKNELSTNQNGRFNTTAMIQQRKAIIITMRNAGDLLDLDTQMRYDEEFDSEGTFLQQQSYNEEEPIKVLRMNKLPNKQYKFSYCEIVGEEDVQNVLSIDLTYGEVKNIQTLVEYSIPLLLGWHCIYNPSVIKTGI
eukprot:403375563